MPVTPSRARPGRRRAALVLVVAAVVLLTACQVDVDVATVVRPDGGGTVTVGVGLDDAALARVGSLDRQLRVDDLRAAGWTVEQPARESDGMTWVRAHKDFSDPAGLAAVTDELTGHDGAFRDFTLTKSSSLLGTDYHYSGTVDLTGGPASFSDPELAAALGGDPFGGTLQAIEQQEGRTADDMVSFRVSVDLPGTSATKVFTPSFHDTAPTEVTASSSRRSVLTLVGIAVAALLALLVVLLVLRRAFRHR